MLSPSPGSELVGVPPGSTGHAAWAVNTGLGTVPQETGAAILALNIPLCVAGFTPTLASTHSLEDWF